MADIRQMARELSSVSVLELMTYKSQPILEDSSCPDEQDPHGFTAFQSSISMVKAFFYPFSNLKDVGGSDQQDVSSIAGHSYLPLSLQLQWMASSSTKRKRTVMHALSMASSASASNSDSGNSFPNAPPPSIMCTDTSKAMQGASDKQSKFDERYKTAMQTNEEVLAAQMKNWTSDIYKHFKMPPVIKMKDDSTVQYLYVCKS
ncbi:hypothetical protein CPB84DRAFT_1843084 [Gymnopilus junonius]|uniref:Uncharacterized protein n=1 Tax=Gymnopilus junonius TaxID=109634 RepID=A0A9P5NWL9_GYMJU|nr:hypothetical protein CPB84DRAFT_1843084 [Gymnopilus junonius]